MGRRSKPSTDSGTDRKTLLEMRRNLPRREYIKALGAAGATAGIAGCSGGGGGDDPAGNDSDDPGTSGDEPVTNEYHCTIESTLPSKVQYNYYNPNASKTNMEPFLLALADRSFVDNKVKGILAKDWSVDGKEITVDLREGFKWQSGEPVNARDFVIAYKIGGFMGDGYWDLVDSIEETGDYSFTITTDKVYNPDYLLEQLFVTFKPNNEAVYGEWLSKFQDAEGDEDAVTTVQENLAQTKIEDPEPVCNSPWRIVDASGSRYKAELVEDHPYAEKINWEYFYDHVRSSTDVQTQRFVNGDDDAAGTDVSANAVQSASFDYETVTIPSYSNWPAILFNHEKEPWNDIHVRKAFAYLCNRKQIADGTQKLVSADEVITGLTSPTAEEEYLSDVIDGYQSYGYDEAKPDKAAAELEKAGFSKQSGRWKRDGVTLQAELPYFPWMTPAINASTAFKSTMSDFGIPISFKSRPNAKLWGNVSDGNYDVAYAYWSGGTPIPVIDLPQGMFDAGWTSVNFPDEVDVPMPVGDPEGDLQTAPIGQWLSDLQNVTDPDAEKDLVQKITWVCNQALPRIPIAVLRRSNYVNVEEWDWPIPAEDNPDVAKGRPYLAWPEKGDISAKTE